LNQPCQHEKKLTEVDLSDPLPGHEDESIERLKIVNSMKEKIQQALSVQFL
jgi:hypothetical protein